MNVLVRQQSLIAHAVYLHLHLGYRRDERYSKLVDALFECATLGNKEYPCSNKSKSVITSHVILIKTRLITPGVRRHDEQVM